MYTVKRQRVNGVQVGCSTADLKEQGIQCSYAEGSFTGYDDLLVSYLWEKDYTLSWLKEEGLIALSRICGICRSDMKWVPRGNRSDGYVWECRKEINANGTGVREVSERKVGSRMQT